MQPPDGASARRAASRLWSCSVSVTRWAYDALVRAEPQARLWRTQLLGPSPTFRAET